MKLETIQIVINIAFYSLAFHTTLWPWHHVSYLVVVGNQMISCSSEDVHHSCTNIRC